jgi:ABC-type methionine transport system permease subunit
MLAKYTAMEIKQSRSQATFRASNASSLKLCFSTYLVETVLQIPVLVLWCCKLQWKHWKGNIYYSMIQDVIYMSVSQPYVITGQ